MPGSCPTTERLAAALRGGPPEGDDADLAAHLTECSACQAQLETLAGRPGWLEAKARTHAANPANASGPLRQALHTLESRAGLLEHEASAPPKLDFLESSEQPGVLGRFGPYQIIAHIASGGMGVVLKARDPALDRIVALKILPPALAANGLARARFVREGRAAAAVVHDHVVPIYAVDECGGLPYLVIQFVQGCSLSERLRASARLRLEEILRIGAQTAAGLAAAHAQGLVHRDVKPGNILLENSVERVKLTDFGLARAVDDAGLTRTGELAGTPEFMAPEQASNATVDHRADLFSFGSVLYAMCTGCSPFQASSVIAVVRRVCDEQPPPAHQVNPSVPRWLSDIIATLMAKSPAERFQSAQEVGELLERYLARVQRGELRELPGAFRGPLTAARMRRRIAIGAAAGLALAALLFFPFKERRIPRFSSPPLSSPQDLFVVRTEAGTSMGEFARIEEAVAAAPSGGVIELCWTGRREVGRIRLPLRPLTLRAGPGFYPVWNPPDTLESGLFASAALTLEGIRFVMASRVTEQSNEAPGASRGQFRPERPRASPSGLALLSITNGPLRITHSLFDAKSLNAPERACIILANVSECHVENTLLFAPEGKAIVWQQYSNVDSAAKAAELMMTNCIAVAGDVFWLDSRDSSRARIEVARSTLFGPEAFCVSPMHAAANLEVHARHNVFDNDFVIFDARNPATPSLPQWVRWREVENLYGPEPRGRRYVAGVALTNGPARLDDWNRWWNQSGANSRQVQIKYANSSNDRNERAGGRNPGRLYRTSPEPGGFRITELRVTEGNLLAPEEWSRFGVDPDSVGPASLK